MTLLVCLAVGDALAQDCPDDIDEPFMVARDGGFAWRVPKGSLRDDELAWCVIEVRSPDGALVDYDVAYAVHPCARNVASFPDIRGRNIVKIECVNALGENPSSKEELVRWSDADGVMLRWRYASPRANCNRGYPVTSPSGQVLCRW